MKEDGPGGNKRAECETLWELKAGGRVHRETTDRLGAGNSAAESGIALSSSSNRMVGKAQATQSK